MLLELTLPGLTSGSAGHSHPGVPLTPRMTEPQAEWTDFSPKTDSPPDILTLSVACNFLIRQALVRPNPCSFPSLPPSGHELLRVAPRAAGEARRSTRSAQRGASPRGPGSALVTTPAATLTPLGLVA